MNTFCCDGETCLIDPGGTNWCVPSVDDAGMGCTHVVGNPFINDCPNGLTCFVNVSKGQNATGLGYCNPDTTNRCCESNANCYTEPGVPYTLQCKPLDAGVPQTWIDGGGLCGNIVDTGTFGYCCVQPETLALSSIFECNYNWDCCSGNCAIAYFGDAGEYATLCE
jgi:hypothetical protein